MITVIIPTLWQCDRLKETLEELSRSPYVGEILLFDNTENDKAIELPKLQHILEGRNTYVGPPWNKGAGMAAFDQLLVLNDDTWMDWNYLAQIIPHITPQNGMLGISRRNYGLKSTKRLTFNSVGRRPNAFACAFFIHKKSWVTIPDTIRIWATDCWLFTKNQQAGRPNYLIEGLPVEGFISKSVEYVKKIHPEKYREIINQDLLMKKKYRLI